MLADDVRRRRHGTQTTFVRVADVGATPARPCNGRRRRASCGSWASPSSRAAAIERVTQVAAAADGAAVSAFSLADLEQLAARESVTLRSLLEELRAAGLELVAEAPVDLLQNARRSIEEVNIAGLALARLTVHRLPSADPMPLLKAVAALQRDVAVVRAFAPLPRTREPGRADDRLRRCEARRAGAPGRRQRAVDPGGLVALRAQARAGGADGRRRRCGWRVGGRRR